ncbi:MAG: CaiB/BaiF CoA transferase family protein, partial [Myxococcota bacterium]
MDSPRPALEGLRVLDLSRLLPGPYCSSLLADLGAEVVKIEGPPGGDYLRWMPPLLGDQSAYFHALNRGKRSLLLSLKHERGIEVFHKLVSAGYDVVIESFRPGVMDRLGLGYEELKKIRPGLILCSITGYGRDGPRSRRAGHDLNFLGLSGVLGMMGPAQEAPVVPGVQIADVGGGSLMAAVGILAALYRRASSGEGAWIDISMTEGALAFLSAHLAARQGMAEPLHHGSGALSGDRPCYSLYRTSDGKLMSVAALEPVFWQALCRVLGREDLIEQGLATGRSGEWAKKELA